MKCNVTLSEMQCDKSEVVGPCEPPTRVYVTMRSTTMKVKVVGSRDHPLTEVDACEPSCVIVFFEPE